ncbi:IDEAL domain-containing protein [Staphylococcus devriesei]|uniref:YpiB family protein n=1 Tax=Staphylococcus devriesei TaxID=586733 RepID=UPI000E67FA1E|nr:YpiB family protein [Staphylococcus devriesei]RIL71676.1 IDEAL domain-containing protein [Staphylococcus devriesei]
MNQTLFKMKQSYIEYALFHYHFKSRISVWILNYLKASPALLNNVHFVNHKVPNHETLEISLKDSEMSAIKLSSNDEALINTNEIFNYIISQHGPFDILFHFDKCHSTDRRLNEVIINQLMYSSQFDAYLDNIHHLSLEPNKKHLLIEQIQHSIDLSLQMNDRHHFYQLSQILNLLNTH